MLKLLDDRVEIQKAQSLLVSKLNSKADKQGIINVGYQGESQQLNAHWSKSLDVWWITEDSGNRFWNAFGTGEPKWNTGKSHNITCEINPPYAGIDRRIAGAFAKDPEGKLFFIHRGKLGGGRPGIGKTLFIDEFRGTWEEVEDGTEFSKVALIASFDNPRFAEQIADFVHEVERIKTVPKATITATKAPAVLTPIFKDEFFGTKKISNASSQTIANSDHGLIVNTLAKELKGKNIKVGNIQTIDLFILDSAGNPTTLFEVKTGDTSTQVYEAIGQLHFHSARLKARCRLIAVFPNSIRQEVKDVFKTLGIQLLTYNFVNNLPVFDQKMISAL